MGENKLPDWQKNFIKDSSVPLPGGGDTHIHPYGPNENDFVITTRIPIPGGDPFEQHDRPTFPDSPLKK